MSADAQAFALADGVELRPVVLADDFPEGIFFVARLFDMLFAAAVGFRLETDVAVVDGRSQVRQFLIRQLFRGFAIQFLITQIAGILSIIRIIHLDDIPLHAFELLLQKSGQVHLSDETDALGVLFVRRGQVRLVGDAPHFRLLQVPDGE